MGEEEAEGERVHVEVLGCNTIGECGVCCGGGLINAAVRGGGGRGFGERLQTAFEEELEDDVVELDGNRRHGDQREIGDILIKGSNLIVDPYPLKRNSMN